VLDIINNKFADHPTIRFYCTSCRKFFDVYSNCGVRSCPVCRYKQFNRLYSGYIDFVQREKPNNLLTLTIVNQPYIVRAWVHSIRTNFSKLLRRVYYKSRISGGMYTIECINKGNDWNVHLHAIISSDEIPKSRLSTDWHILTGDSYIVDIEPIESIEKAFRYILKDFMKTPPLNGQENEYNEAMRRFRFVSKFGTWYKVSPKSLSPGKCPHCGSLDLLSEYYLDSQIRIMHNLDP